MHASRKVLVLFGAISLTMTCALTLAAAPSFASSVSVGGTGAVGGASDAPVLLAHSTATSTPSCKTLPVAQVTRILSTSIVAPVVGWPSGVLNEMGQQVLIGGKPLTVHWLDCNYAHNPKDPSSVGVDVSYAVEPTSAKASTIVKAMCSAMRLHTSSYQAPRIGNGACLQGHTGYMQSSNGVLAVKNVVVTFFGSTSPSQTSALIGVVARILAVARISTTTTMPQPKNPNGPVVKVTSTQYQVGNGMIPVRLSCVKAKCSGVIQLTTSTSSGTVILAQGKYNMPSGSTMTFNVSLTTTGQSFFAATTDNPIQAKVNVTLGGGKPVNAAITVYTGSSSPPTSAVTTTTEVTTTSLAAG